VSWFCVTVKLVTVTISCLSQEKVQTRNKDVDRGLRKFVEQDLLFKKWPGSIAQKREMRGIDLATPLSVQTFLQKEEVVVALAGTNVVSLSPSLSSLVERLPPAHKGRMMRRDLLLIFLALTIHSRQLPKRCHQMDSASKASMYKMCASPRCVAFMVSREHAGMVALLKRVAGSGICRP